jgi:hypothetical protein
MCVQKCKKSQKNLNFFKKSQEIQKISKKSQKISKKYQKISKHLEIPKITKNPHK